MWARGGGRWGQREGVTGVEGSGGEVEELVGGIGWGNWLGEGENTLS